MPNIALVSLSIRASFLRSPAVLYPLTNSPSRIMVTSITVSNLFNTALHIAYGSEVDIRRSQFHNSLSSAIAIISAQFKTFTSRTVFSSAFSVIGCSFLNCYSTDNGGAIYYNASSGGATVSGCLFINCVSTGNGGAINFLGESLYTIGNCFSSCYATLYGSAINCYGLSVASSLSVLSSIIYLCGNSSSYRGAVMSYNNSKTFTSTNISSCVCGDCGAFGYLILGAITITSSQVHNCSGAAIMEINSGDGSITDSLGNSNIINNVPYSYSILRLGLCIMTISNCAFIGTGVMLTNYSIIPITFASCVIDSRISTVAASYYNLCSILSSNLISTESAKMKQRCNTESIAFTGANLGNINVYILTNCLITFSMFE